MVQPTANPNPISNYQLPELIKAIVSKRSVKNNAATYYKCIFFCLNSEY